MSPVNYRVTHVLEVTVERVMWAANRDAAANPASVITSLPAAWRQNTRVIETTVDVIPQRELDDAARARVIANLARELNDEQLLALAKDINRTVKKGTPR